MATAHFVIEGRKKTGIFQTGFQFQQFKVLNNQPYAIYIHLTTETPDKDHYTYLVEARGQVTSPPVAATAFSYSMSDYSAKYPSPEVFLWEDVREGASSLKRELQAQEAVAGYPFVSTAPGVNFVNYTLPEIPIFNHMPVMFLISNRNVVNNIAHVLRGSSPWPLGGVFGVDYLYGSGMRGVYTYVPSEETTVLAPELFVRTQFNGDILESTVYAYYTRNPLTVHYTQGLIIASTGTEGGLRVDSSTPQTIYFGLNAGNHLLQVVYRPTTVNANPTLNPSFSLFGTNTADIFEERLDLIPAGEVPLFSLLTTRTYRLLSCVVQAPRPCFGGLTVSTASSSVFRIYPSLKYLEA